MPSPIGHAIAGVTAGWLVARPDTRSRAALIVQSIAFAAIAAAPDLDLLVDRHSRETHSLGAAVVVASVAALLRWPLARSRPFIWLAVFAAWFSHPCLDTLAPDHAPPIGVMLWWPFSDRHVLSGIEIFLPITRDLASPNFVMLIARAVAREMIVLVPIALVVYWLRRRPA